MFNYTIVSFTEPTPTTNTNWSISQRTNVNVNCSVKRSKKAAISTDGNITEASGYRGIQMADGGPEWRTQ